MVFGLLGKVEVEQIVGNVYILTSVVGQVMGRKGEVAKEDRYHYREYRLFVNRTERHNVEEDGRASRRKGT